MIGLNEHVKKIETQNQKNEQFIQYLFKFYFHSF